MTKKLDRPEFEALVLRIASGEITRKEAAQIAHEQTGLSASTFQVWLSSSGHGAELKHGNKGRLRTDPDKAAAYAQAVKDVVDGGAHPEKVAKALDLSFGYLRRLVAEERKSQAPAAAPVVEETSDLTQADAYVAHLRRSDPQRYIRIAKLAQAGL